MLIAFSIFAAFFLLGTLSQSKLEQQLLDLRAKAEQGDAKAQNSLGWRYEEGKGVAQDTSAHASGIAWLPSRAMRREKQIFVLL